MATSDVLCAIGFQDSEEWAMQSLEAVARATRFLAGMHGVELEGVDGMVGPATTVSFASLRIR